MGIVGEIQRGMGVLWRHPVRSTVAAGGVAWLFDPFNYLASPTDIMNWALRWALGPQWTMSDLVESWGFKIVVLFLVLAVIWWIGRSSLRDEQRRGALEQERLVAEAAAQDRVQRATAESVGKALAVPTLLTRYYSFHRALMLLDAAIHEVEEAVQAYKSRSARWLRDEPFNYMPEHVQADLYLHGLHLLRTHRFRHFTPPEIQKSPPVEAIVSASVKGSMDGRHYDPAANRVFRERLGGFISGLTNQISRLKEFRAKQAKEMDKLDEQIREASDEQG